MSKTPPPAALPALTDSEIVALFSERKINTAFVLYSPHEQSWSAYVKVDADRREWQLARSYREAVAMLVVRPELVLS